MDIIITWLIFVIIVILLYIESRLEKIEIAIKNSNDYKSNRY